MALSADGRVLAWGANQDGQTNVPPGISNALAIAAGKFDSLALVGDAQAAPALRAEEPAYSQGVFSVFVLTRLGRYYRLEYKDRLDDPSWTELPAQPGDGTRMRLTAPSAAPQRYYRVREL